jgi:hypothetical protein
MEAKNILDKGDIKENILEHDNGELPDILNNLYKTLGYNKSLHIDNWVVMSMREVSDYNAELYKRNIFDIYNFAYAYLGMGWVMVAAIDLKNQKVFIRREGGSNGYDCEFNLQKTKQYRNNTNNNKYDEKYLSIEQFFKKLTNQPNYDIFEKYILW